MPLKTFCVAAVMLFVVYASAIAIAVERSAMTKPPVVGDKAPDFVLKDLQRKEVSLGDQLKQGPVVVIVLRGYPGYQCPICSRQFAELIGKGKEFAAAKATVLFVYPGPADDLDKYAKEFVGGKTFPENYRFLIDPDFKFTELYGLRWNAPKETAFPSSFVVGRNDVIAFAKVSRSHGDRATSGELLKALSTLSM